MTVVAARRGRFRNGGRGGRGTRYDPYKDREAVDSFSNRARTLDELVADLVGDPYIKRGLGRADLLDAVPGVLEAVLGAGAGENCRAISLRSDVLILETTDSMWARTVAMSVERLLAGLAAAELEVVPAQIEVRTRVG